MAPTMTVLGINSFNQTHRISPAEAQAANMPGGYAERFNAWATKAFSGKLSPQVAQEGTQIMDSLIDSAHQRSIQSSLLIANGHQVPVSQMPAMDRAGNITTLDRIPAKTGVGKVDGKVHNLNILGRDLGVKQ